MDQNKVKKIVPMNPNFTINPFGPAGYMSLTKLNICYLSGQTFKF